MGLRTYEFGDLGVADELAQDQDIPEVEFVGRSSCDLFIFWLCPLLEEFDVDGDSDVHYFDVCLLIFLRMGPISAGCCL